MTTRHWTVSLALTGVLIATAGAVDNQQENEGSAEEVESQTRGTDYRSAASIDFRAELNLSFDSLTSLGQRIELARRHADPVGLAISARELQVAESVSGKTVAITSSVLMQEAVDLARMRHKSSELTAVSMLTIDEEAGTKLTKLAEQAQSSEEEAQEAAREGAKIRGIYNDLIVNNHSHDYVRIYYNGYPIGYIAPHQHRYFHVHDHGHGHFFNLQARGHSRYWRRNVHGDFRDYQWTIH